ncbi:MAG TPA: CsgG/HfaB family protein [Thermoanaerobaculia bacterium]|nr:CsgG/HfaB family protein [Thermoanaerobaculia bacterium]
MRKSIVIGLTLALAFTALLPAAAAASEQKPRIAVLEFKNKADNQYWYRGGAEAAQDVFVTELVKSGKFRVVEREQLQALMQEKNLALSGDMDASTAMELGKLLGVHYLLTGAVTEYGDTKASVNTPGVARHGKWVPGTNVGKSSFTAAMNARLIDVSTGEIVWADEARGDDSNVRVRVGGFGGGVDHDNKMFDKVMKPVIQQLVASIKAADI